MEIGHFCFDPEEKSKPAAKNVEITPKTRIIETILAVFSTFICTAAS